MNLARVVVIAIAKLIFYLCGTNTWASFCLNPPQRCNGLVLEYAAGFR
jgi:hypothetical protein